MANYFRCGDGGLLIIDDEEDELQNEEVGEERLYSEWAEWFFYERDKNVQPDNGLRS